jgi:hypothetical protein
MLEMFALASATITLIGGMFVVLQGFGEGTNAVAVVASTMIAGVNAVFFAFALLLLFNTKQGALVRWRAALTRATGCNCACGEGKSTGPTSAGQLETISPSARVQSPRYALRIDSFLSANPLLRPSTGPHQAAEA